MSCCTKSTAERSVPEDPEEIVAEVRRRYGGIGAGGGSSCCSPALEGVPPTPGERLGYNREELEQLPEGADLGLGCGAPISQLELRAGETVLDLGSGGGIDALLAARRVGPSGRVIGVDMTPEMLERARAAARAAGCEQVEIREGRLEALPVADSSVDAVTSNCVINLVPDKRAVFREIARVLKPGGRLVISDIVLTRPLPPAIERDLLAWVGCLAGAEERDSYLAGLRAAGLEEIEILRDVDAIELFGGQIPAEVVEILQRSGFEAAQLAGTVRSITYRAIRP